MYTVQMTLCLCLFLYARQASYLLFYLFILFLMVFFSLLIHSGWNRRCQGLSVCYSIVCCMFCIYQPWPQYLQLDYDIPVAEALSELNNQMKGKKMRAGDLKKASRDLLPGLMKKMKEEIARPGVSPQQRKAKIQQFNKVCTFIASHWMLHLWPVYFVIQTEKR